MIERRSKQVQSKGTRPRPTGDFAILLKVRDTLDSDGTLNWDEALPVSE